MTGRSVYSVPFAAVILRAFFCLFLLQGCSDNDRGEDPEEDIFIAPPTICRPTEADGKGSATLEPDAPVPIGANSTWTIKWTAEEPGVEPGGFVILQISPWWGWTRPQTFDPGFPGFMKVDVVHDDPSLQVLTLQLNRILVTSKERGFRPGESITFTYMNARADKFAEAEEMFQIMVDGDGDGYCAILPASPLIRILPREAVRIEVGVPSQAGPGDTVTVSAAPLDGLGNWSTFPKETRCTVQVTRNGEEAGTLTLSARDGETPALLTAGYKLPDREGVYFFEVKEGRLLGKSNPLLCRRGERRLNVYFGDIHGHSRLSDGTGTPEDYFRYARSVSRLDISALTDHDSYGTFPIQGKPWERIKKAVNAAYELGSFVTFLGYEWTNWTSGHRNVYFRDGEGEVFSAAEERSSTPEGLWKCLEPYTAMTIAHHTGGGPIRTDWTIAPGHKERLVEISSIHGSSESYGCRSCIYRPVEGSFVFDALERDYRLGIIGSGDTHDGHPGQRSYGSPTSGLFGLFAEELTREAVWNSFQRRHTYGTSGKKIILFVRVADSPMGSETAWPADKESVPVAIRTVGCGPLEAVEIIRNGKTVFRTECFGVESSLLAEDSEPLDGTSWYMVRVTQKDGHTAWSSPVWVTR